MTSSRPRSKNKARGHVMRDVLTFTYLTISLFVFVVYPVLGYIEEHGVFDINTFFTKPIFGNYRISLLDAVLDAEQLVANFMTSVLFSLVLSAFLVHYGPVKAELEPAHVKAACKHRTGWLLVITVAVLGTAILVASLGLGYHRPEFGGQTLYLLFGNFHAENFSIHALYYLFLVSGLPGMLYLLAASKASPRRAGWIPEQPRAGLFFWIVALLIMEAIAICSPFVLNVALDNRAAMREIVYSIIDGLFITGIVLCVERRDRKSIVPPVTDGMQKVTPIVRHVVYWSIPVTAFFVVTAVMFSLGYLELFISVAFFLSRTWTFAFTVMFTILLYHVGILFKAGVIHFDIKRWNKVIRIVQAKPRILAGTLIACFVTGGVLFTAKPFIDRPIVLLNQAGYLPFQDKFFNVKTSYMYSNAQFDVINATDGTNLFPGMMLDYLGTSWCEHYYRGNVTNITVPGSYLVVAKFYSNGLLISSSPAEPLHVGMNVYDLAARRGYEFFYYQRCGAKVHELVPGYVGHETCHMDDHIMYKGTYLNLTGGWHSAGDYAKHIYWGMHCEGVIYSCLFAYEMTPSMYDGIDNYNVAGQLAPDGIPDILDEAMFGLEFFERSFLDNGTLLGSLLGRLIFCPPEHDTDGIPGNEDDRHLMWEENHVVARPYEAMYVAAGFAKMASIARETGYFASRELEMFAFAENIFDNFSMHFNYSAPNYPPINSDMASFLVAALEMYRYTNSSIYGDRLAGIASYIHGNFPDPAILWGDELGEWNRVPGYMCYWAMINASTVAKSMASDISNLMYNNRFLPLIRSEENYFGVLEMKFNDGHSQLFWDRIGMNSYYLAAAFSAFMAYNITGGTREDILHFGLQQLGFVFGNNPFGISMVENVGTRNPPIYHHRYAHIPGNPRGAVPGAIVNGIILKRGVPFLNVNSAAGSSIQNQIGNAMSNEPWLPHNVHFMLAISALQSIIRR